MQRVNRGTPLCQPSKRPFRHPPAALVPTLAPAASLPQAIAEGVAVVGVAAVVATAATARPLLQQPTVTEKSQIIVQEPLPATIVLPYAAFARKGGTYRRSAGKSRVIGTSDLTA